jgi:hypothetical protein
MLRNTISVVSKQFTKTYQSFYFFTPATFLSWRSIIPKLLTVEKYNWIYVQLM